jgi:hypothetical protein
MHPLQWRRKSKIFALQGAMFATSRQMMKQKLQWVSILWTRAPVVPQPKKASVKAALFLGELILGV